MFIVLFDFIFIDIFKVDLGDSYVLFNYYGFNNGWGNVSMCFMFVNVFYVVDWIVFGCMLYKNLIGYDINGMLYLINVVLNEFVFVVFIGGYVDIGNCGDVVFYLYYI